MASGGEVTIEITAQDSGYTYNVSVNTTPQDAVTFTAGDNDLQLTADPGVYAFIFIAMNFHFAANTVVWKQPSANRNLTWMSKDNTQFAMTNINYATLPQYVQFTITPDNDANSNGFFLPPIDPTILNNPMPTGSDNWLQGLPAPAFHGEAELA